MHRVGILAAVCGLAVSNGLRTRAAEDTSGTAGQRGSRELNGPEPPTPVADAAWSQLDGTAANDGRTTNWVWSEGLTLKWAYEPTLLNAISCSNPVVIPPAEGEIGGGTLAFGVTNGTHYQLVGLDAMTSDFKWESRVASSYSYDAVTPAVLDTSTVVWHDTNDGGLLVGTDVSDGSTRWSLPLGGTRGTSSFTVTEIEAGGAETHAIYFVGNSQERGVGPGMLYRVGVHTGDDTAMLAWNVTLTNNPDVPRYMVENAAPAVASDLGYVFVGTTANSPNTPQTGPAFSEFGNVTAFQVSNGGMVWNAPQPGFLESSVVYVPPTSAAGVAVGSLVVFTVSDFEDTGAQAFVKALDAQTGLPIWDTTLPDFVQSSPALYLPEHASGTPLVYAAVTEQLGEGDERGSFRALAINDGRQVWTSEMSDDTIARCDPTVTETTSNGTDLVMCAGTDGIWAYDAVHGGSVFTLPFEGGTMHCTPSTCQPQTSLVVGAEGHIYLAFDTVMVSWKPLLPSPTPAASPSGAPPPPQPTNTPIPFPSASTTPAPHHAHNPDDTPMTGGQKAGLAFGLIFGIGAVAYAGWWFKKRQGQETRRSAFATASSGTAPGTAYGTGNSVHAGVSGGVGFSSPTVKGGWRKYLNFS